MQIHIRRKEKKKKKSELSRKEEKTHTHKLRLGWSTLLFVRVRNPLLQDRRIIRILKNVIGPLKG